MFSFRRKQDRNKPEAERQLASHGCFGKHPCHDEYIRVHAGDPDTHAFYHWLQEGVCLLQKKQALRGQERGIDIPRTRFALMDPETQSLLAGVIAPSKDRTGRSYPLCLHARTTLPVGHRARNRLMHVIQVLEAFSDLDWQQLDTVLHVHQLEEMAGRLADLLAVSRETDVWDKMAGEGIIKVSSRLEEDVERLLMSHASDQSRIYKCHYPKSNEIQTDMAQMGHYFVRSLLEHGIPLSLLWNSPDDVGSTILYVIAGNRPVSCFSYVMQNVHDASLIFDVFHKNE